MSVGKYLQDRTVYDRILEFDQEAFPILDQVERLRVSRYIRHNDEELGPGSIKTRVRHSSVPICSSEHDVVFAFSRDEGSARSTKSKYPSFSGMSNTIIMSQLQ